MTSKKANPGQSGQPESGDSKRIAFFRKKAVGLAMLGLSGVLILVMLHCPPSLTLYGVICLMAIGGLFQLFRLD